MILTIFTTIQQKDYNKGIGKGYSYLSEHNLIDTHKPANYDDITNIFKSTMAHYNIKYKQLSDNEFELYPETKKEIIRLRKFKKEALKIIHE